MNILYNYIFNITALNAVLGFSLLSIFIIALIPNYRILFLKQLTLSLSILQFIIIFIILLFKWDHTFLNYQFYNSYSINISDFFININMSWDNLSIWFIILTTFLFPFCILISWNSVKNKIKEYYLSLFILEFLLILSFSVVDLLLFYVIFELILLPTFLIIGIWGSRQRKIHAAYQLFLYTIIGSILMFINIIFINVTLGTTDIFVLYNELYLKDNYQIYIWISFFLSFAIKIPMIPFHIWLPEAHVEAPTAGSVLLAGILLKLGTYAMLRFLIPLMPFYTVYFTPLVYTICIISIIYASFTTIRQIDLKKIIAYSSVAHMNYALLGLYSNTIEGISGSLYIMLGHGIVSSALFLCIGIIYDRYHTRNILYYGGLIFTMPIFCSFLLLFTLGNIAFPGTVNFVGELLVLLAIIKNNTFIGFIGSLGIFLSIIYAIWLYNRIIYGILKKKILSKFIDLNFREWSILIPLCILMFIMGIKPTFILEFFNNLSNTYIYIEKYYNQDILNIKRNNHSYILNNEINMFLENNIFLKTNLEELSFYKNLSYNRNKLILINVNNLMKNFGGVNNIGFFKGFFSKPPHLEFHPLNAVDLNSSFFVKKNDVLLKNMDLFFKSNKIMNLYFPKSSSLNINKGTFNGFILSSFNYPEIDIFTLKNPFFEFNYISNFDFSDNKNFTKNAHVEQENEDFLLPRIIIEKNQKVVKFNHILNKCYCESPLSELKKSHFIKNK